MSNAEGLFSAPNGGDLNCIFKFHPYMEFNPANLLPINSGI